MPKSQPHQSSLTTPARRNTDQSTGADGNLAVPALTTSNDYPPPLGWRLSAYRGAMRAATHLAPLILDWRRRKGKEDAARLGERRGIARLARPPGPLLWLHAASVGETNAVLPVIRTIKAQRPDVTVLLTTVTVTSALIAEQRLSGIAIHQYVPLDTPRFVASFLDHWRPDVAAFTESEIWPNLIVESDRRRIPLVLVNARMSDRSYQSWRKQPAVSRPLFGRFTRILAQNDQLVAQYLELGARQVEAAGNLKVDAPALPVNQGMRADLDAALANRPRWIAASTHDGEETEIAAAHLAIRLLHPNVVTILVPRHPERGASIEPMLAAAGLTVTRRSSGALPTAATDVYLADTIGELGLLYSLAPVAFVGGSLIERGGQNPIEAVRTGAAVLTGPHRKNFTDVYDPLIAGGGAIETCDAAALALTVIRLLSDPSEAGLVHARAAAVVATLAGALDRTIAVLLAELDRVEGGARAS
jgi:3-deoxy-D-manno-octulosonic-acid transferase